MRRTRADEIVSFEFDLVSSEYLIIIVDVVIIVIVPCWSLRLAFNCFASEKNMTRVRLPPLCYGLDTQTRAPIEARTCNRKSES
jgi:hypothetical protein